MSKLYERSLIGMMVLAIALFVTACETPQTPGPPQLPKQPLNRPTARPINSIRVGNFQCNNEVTGQAVRNVFVEVLARSGDVKVVREGEADVVIEGTVTLAVGGSSSGRIGGGKDFIVGKSQGVGGDYVSGVTSLVLRNGEIITSASWGQDIGKDSALMSPETVARRAADRLLPNLLQLGMKRR